MEFVIFPLFALVIVAIFVKFLKLEQATAVVIAFGIAALFYLFASSAIEMTMQIKSQAGMWMDYLAPIYVLVGLAALIVSFLLKTNASIQAGFAIGGLVLLIRGATGNFSQIDDKVYLFLLGAGLVLLVWVGMKKIKA